ncbi:hypothetical protein [Falsiroseomonas selenitidurans]|uniref:Alpha/beta hydrolase n=1 Tax=Falsiroseomonas selenitidurans TaxID=2716335 RepID=A0ABX1EBH4_9PROT|nr:hypothetical protein [Falsiroseomonas selenitidurans]NKC34176.1 hypothetical protein [Falsiroseomonas selenitidurans]
MLTPIRFEIAPPLEAATGLALDPATGVIAGTPGANREDHRPASGRAHRITLLARNALTGTEQRLEAEFRYRFADSAPLRVTQRYPSRLVWEPFMGDGFHARPVVEGGSGPIRYALSPATPLPAGFQLDGATGALRGRPRDNLRGDRALRVQARDRRGRETWLSATLALAPPAQARGPNDLCFIFVHGHQDLAAGKDPVAESRRYWARAGREARPADDDETMVLLNRRLSWDLRQDFIDLVTNNRTDRSAARWRATGEPIRPGETRHHYAVLHYDSHRPYWLAAEELAARILAVTRGDPDPAGNLCDPAAVRGFVVVAHSMGGTVVSYINGNANPDGENPRRQRVFTRAMQHIDAVVTVQSPLQGALTADYICGKEVDGIWDDLIRAAFTCDAGTRSLTTSAASRLENRIAPGRLYRPTLMAGGHVGIYGTTHINPATIIEATGLTAADFFDTMWGITPGVSSNGRVFYGYAFSGDILENDGVVEIRSQWACRTDTYGDTHNNLDRGRHHYAPCRADRTIRPGFTPFVMTTETHDDGRNGYTRGVIANPCRTLQVEAERVRNLRWTTAGCVDNSVAEQAWHAPLEMNIAESIRCFLGDGFGDSGPRPGACPSRFALLNLPPGFVAAR